MNQIKRYGFMALFFAAGLTLVTSAWAEHTVEHQADVASETTIGGKVGTVDQADRAVARRALRRGWNRRGRKR